MTENDKRLFYVYAFCRFCLRYLTPADFASPSVFNTSTFGLLHCNEFADCREQLLTNFFPVSIPTVVLSYSIKPKFHYADFVLSKPAVIYCSRAPAVECHLGCHHHTVGNWVTVNPPLHVWASFCRKFQSCIFSVPAERTFLSH